TSQTPPRAPWSITRSFGIEISLSTGRSSPTSASPKCPIFQVAHVPRAPSGGRAGLLRGNVLAIPAGAQNPEGAWRLIAFVLDDASQERTAQDGYLPSRISIAQSEYLERGFYP